MYLLLVKLNSPGIGEKGKNVRTWKESELYRDN